MITPKSYPGAKTNTGIIQFLVNHVPYHERYFELFAGTAQLFLNLRTCKQAVLSDLNCDVVEALHHSITTKKVHIYHAAAINLLQHYKFTRKDFIYLDPPYPASARRSGAKYYKFELLSDNEHLQLLQSVMTINANIMISSKPNDLYRQVLHDWNKATFYTTDRVGSYEEIIYMNYATPPLLHQYNHLGADCWDRQAIKRKISRFADKIKALPVHQKHLIIQAIIENDTAAVQHFLNIK